MVCYPTFGGSGVVATELGKALAANGHEVHFITYDQPVRLGSFRPNVFYHEVRISQYPLFDYPPYELVLASKMVEVVRQQNLDLLHVLVDLIWGGVLHLHVRVISSIAD